MDDVLTRLVVIGGALAIAAAVTVALRARWRSRPRVLRADRLGPGVYLFTSQACPDCSLVADRLTDALGDDGFEELSWEERAEVFAELDVDAVPSTMIVAEDGSARLWRGRPDPALAALGP